MFKLFNKKEPKANWIADLESVAGLEKYYKNDDILVTNKGDKFSFSKIFSKTSHVTVNKPYGVIEFSITPFASDAFNIFGKYNDYCYSRDVNLESYELKDIENNIRKTIIEIIIDIENDLVCTKIKNDIFKRIEKELNNEDFMEGETK